MSAYPKDDAQFEDVFVAKVTAEGDGWSIKRSDGWSFFVPANSPIVPEAGMPVRFYGKGIGFPVRGLFLAGVKVYYRNEAEEQDCREVETYGADADDWLKRWDEGRSCWSIEMGGLGPGYEQCIQITIAEILRNMLAKKYDATTWKDEAAWKHDQEEIDAAMRENATITELGLSGAQWGAALHLATKFYMEGPRTIMTDERVKDRHIQVSRTFPGVAA